MKTGHLPGLTEESRHGCFIPLVEAEAHSALQKGAVQGGGGGENATSATDKKLNRVYKGPPKRGTKTVPGIPKKGRVALTRALSRCAQPL